MRVLVLLLLAWCAVSALLGTSLAVLSTLTRRRLRVVRGHESVTTGVPDGTDTRLVR